MESKRKALKTLVAVGAVSSLPTSWKKPIVDSVILPSHAETSPVEDPTTATISGPDSFQYGTSPTFTVTIFDDNGVESAEYEVFQTSSGVGPPNIISESGTGTTYTASPILDIGGYEITWIITGKKADGSPDDISIAVVKSFSVTCPAGQVPNGAGLCVDDV